MSSGAVVEIAIVVLVATSLALFAWDRARTPRTEERTVGAIFSNPYLRILTILLMVLVVLRSEDARVSLTWLPAIVVLIIGTTVAGADFILLLVALLKNNEIFIRQHYRLELERFRAQAQVLPTATEAIAKPATRRTRTAEPEVALDPILQGLEVIGVSEAKTSVVSGDVVRVALISTGAPDPVVEHPAFAGRVERTFGAEGTVVGNEIGAAGIGFVAAIAPNARIFPITVFDASLLVANDAWIVEGLEAAISWDAHVVVLGFGSGQPSAAVSAVMTRLADQVLFVAPAGNDGRSGASWPASERAVLGVAAVDAGKRLASFSSYGRGVRLAAPGERVVSLLGVQKGQLAFGEMSGTSFAADVVAGVAALGLSIGTKTPSEIGAELVATGSPVVGRPSLRVVDAAALVARVGGHRSGGG